MSENTQQPYAIPAAIVIAGALIAGAMFFAQPKQQMAAQQGNNQPAGPVAVDQVVKGVQKDDYVVGNRDAKVVIVEFSDSECPFCKLFHDTMNKLMNEYGDSGKVAWVYRHYPIPQLHQKAKAEAIAQECAGKLGGNEAFWKFTNNLYAVTPSNAGLDHTQCGAMATKAGVDAAAFASCVKNQDTLPEVEADIKEGEALGVNGTPQSFLIVNGKQTAIEGAQRYESVKQMIEQALAQ
jgi:protein-disulfide isomerase